MRVGAAVMGVTLVTGVFIAVIIVVVVTGFFVLFVMIMFVVIVTFGLIMMLVMVIMFIVRVVVMRVVVMIVVFFGRVIPVMFVMAVVIMFFAAVIIVGGVLSGIFTVTESGAFGTIYAVLVTVLVYRSLSWEDFRTAVVRAVRTLRLLGGVAS